MTINTNAIISVSEANQNFTKATRLAEQHGQAIIFKNNKEEIKIEKFTELLDIHDNLQLPIMYYSVKDHEEAYFYICHDNVVYVHNVNANDVEKKK